MIGGSPSGQVPRWSSCSSRHSDAHGSLDRARLRGGRSTGPWHTARGCSSLDQRRRPIRSACSSHRTPNRETGPLHAPPRRFDCSLADHRGDRPPVRLGNPTPVRGRCDSFDGGRLETHLHERLRSSSAVLSYVERVVEAGAAHHVALGEEMKRLAKVVAADRQWAAQGRTTARPWLPERSDPLGSRVFQEMRDHVWEDDGVLPWVDPDDYRQIVAFLDEIPPSLQPEIGRLFLRKTRQLDTTGLRASGFSLIDQSRLLVILWDDHDHHASLEHFVHSVAMLTAARREAIGEQLACDITAVGVGAVIRRHPVGVAYAYCYMAGDLPALPSALRSSFELEFGRVDLPRGRVGRVRPGRNDPCPCGSLKKYKHCCGRG